MTEVTTNDEDKTIIDTLSRKEGRKRFVGTETTNRGRLSHNLVQDVKLYKDRIRPGPALGPRAPKLGGRGRGGH